MAQAVRDTEKIPCPSFFVELDNDCQTSAMSSPKFIRRQSRKRRGRKRRMDSNLVWEHTVKFSEGSDTSLDEAQKDYMENVAHHSDSASEDTLIMRRLSSLNVTSSSNLYGESDSVTENHVLPKQPLRRKKRFKRMVVDPTHITSGACPTSKIKFSCSGDFLPETSRKKHKLKRSKNTVSDNAENAPQIDGGDFGFDILGVKLRKRGSTSKTRQAKNGKSDSSPQSPCPPDHAISSDGSLPRRVSTESPVSLPDSSSGTGRKLSGSDGASEKTIGREMECTSNESDVTMDATTSKDSSDSDSLTSSDDEGALYTNDEGREGDDEQSDFFQEPEGVSGIPGIIPWWEKKSASRAKEDERFSNILNGTFPLLSRNSQRNFQSRLRSLQNGDEGQIRGCRPRIHKTKAKRLKRTSLSAVNDKIVGFLRNPQEKELLFQPMKKKERTQLGELASLYSLDMRTEGATCKRSPILVKTRSSAMADPNIDEALGLVSVSADSVSPARRSLGPQFVDAKRRRKTPPSTITEGQVGRSAIPIPESNRGCQMLQGMGWVPGTGLGADGGGIKEPIRAYVRPKNRGLGYWKPR